jgi:serpin B
MHRRALLVSAASAALAACTDARTPPDPALDAFDVALYREVAGEAGNHFVSPFSIACALALVYPGARGQTAAEIVAACDFDPSPAAQAARLRALAQTLTTQTGGSEFTTANAAWVERSMALRAEYARMVREDLGAGIEAVDFIADQPAALQRINSWAARETHERIREILADSDPDRRLVLTNAVYFKGKWRNPFSARETQDGNFYAASSGSRRARLMRQLTYARYFEDEGLQVAEFDYDNGEFGLAVFLPRKRKGLVGFERQLTGSHLDAWLQRLTIAAPTHLDVTLPKVEIDASYNLVPHLEALGLRAAFTDSADFSGIAEQTPLAVSAVIHKTFLAIDEAGTEAGAVTAFGMNILSAPPPAIAFKADHPFFMVLRHRRTSTRLFLGRMAAVPPS